MQAQELSLKATDGAPIHLYRWLPDAPGDVRGIVQIIHGMAEHANRYSRLAKALTDAGWAVYAHDQRGHGKTAAKADLGHFADEGGWSLVVDDARIVRKFAREAHPGPLALFGHSMGSFVALHETTDSPSVDALILSGTNRGGGPLVQAGRLVALLEKLRLGGRGKSALLDKLSFGEYRKPFKPAKTEFDWLSRDDAEVAAYVNDPLCGFECTTTLWTDLLGGLIDLGDKKRLAKLPRDLPIYLFAGSEDPVGNRTKGIVALVNDMKAAGLKKVEYHFYPNARHEALNETNRDEVTRDLVGWLDRALPRAQAAGRALRSAP